MKVYLVAFFKPDDKGLEYGFKRIDLQIIMKTLKQARRFAETCFCDEAGWYSHVLIEERMLKHQYHLGKRIWYKQEVYTQFTYSMIEFPEPKYWNNCIGLIG